VTVEIGGAESGRTRLANCGEGAVTIAAEVDSGAAEEEIVQRLVG
jgi:hypothetical protein